MRHVFIFALPLVALGCAAPLEQEQELVEWVWSEGPLVVEPVSSHVESDTITLVGSGFCEFPVVSVAGEPVDVLRVTPTQMTLAGPWSALLEGAFGEQARSCDWKGELDVTVDCSVDTGAPERRVESSVAFAYARPSFREPEFALVDALDDLSPFSPIRIEAKGATVGAIELEMEGVPGHTRYTALNSVYSFVPDSLLEQGRSYLLHARKARTFGRAKCLVEGGGETLFKWQVTTRASDEPAFRMTATRRGSRVYFDFDRLARPGVLEYWSTYARVPQTRGSVEFDADITRWSMSTAQCRYETEFCARATVTLDDGSTVTTNLACEVVR